MLKVLAIERHKDVDFTVVAVLDEVMLSMTGPVGISSAHHEPAEFTEDIFRYLSANHTVGETGSSSSAGK